MRSSSKIAPELQKGETGSGQELVRVIVQTKGRPSSAQQDAVVSSRGKVSRSYEALNALVV